MISNNLSVIITSSHIQSHPNIKIIKETIDSLKLINEDNLEIIITHDYSENVDFLNYLNNLKEYIKNLKYKNIKILTSDKHVHLTGTIRNAINYVKTKYVLIVQHDLSFIKKFEIDKIILDMEKNPKIKCVRFNKRENIKTGFDGINDLFGKEIECENYSYTRTPAWSDNNHLCLSSYYEKLILKECLDGKPMEEQVHGRSINEETHSKWGTYLFGKNYEGPYIKHTDGKNYTGQQKILPYMNNTEIVDLISYITKDTEMLEIGGGHSTIFLSKFVKRLVTIEHNSEWSKSIQDSLKNFNVDWTLYLIEPNWPQKHPFCPAEDGQFTNYVNFISTLSDNQFDVVLIDGRDRVKCSLASIPKLKVGGILLVHDFWNRKKYHSLIDVPELELIVDSNSYSNLESNTLVAFVKI